MVFSRWLDAVRFRLQTPTPTPRRLARLRRRIRRRRIDLRPALEKLEDRTLLSTVTLTATADAGLRGDMRDSAEGLDDKLLTRESDPSYALVQFDTSTLTMPVSSAFLRMEWHT
ncbi:MAG TPA: hypothetical protein VML55_05555, partial [Planctomycetaceae bacterium]|nr:hypothetical protein [Planctomycetaceae bacterium]